MACRIRTTVRNAEAARVTERWKAVVGYEGAYEVSDTGVVRSLPRPGRKNLLELAPGRDKDGYEHVELFKDGVGTVCLIHQLVLKAYRGARPVGRQAAHLDGNRQNNYWKNLRWKTVKGNAKDRTKHGTVLAGEKHYAAKMNWQTVKRLRALRSTGMKLSLLAEMFQISVNQASRIALRRSWK